MIHCPHCKAPLTDQEALSIRAQYAVSKRRNPNRDMSNRTPARKGGRPKGSKNKRTQYSSPIPSQVMQS